MNTQKTAATSAASRMQKRAPRTSAVVLAVAALASSMVTARADLWGSSGPTLGGAIAAKAIASACPNLMSDRDIADLESYIVKRRAEIAAISSEDALSFNSFAPALEAEYARSDRCTDEGEDMAKDMLKRVKDWLENGD